MGKIKYNIRLSDGKLQEVEGEIIDINGIKIGIDKRPCPNPRYSKYHATELQSGFGMFEESKRNDLIQRCQDFLSDPGHLKSLQTLRASGIAKYGYANEGI